MTRVIEMDRVRKSYRGRVAVDAVSLAVDAGEVLGVLGPNGSGKTTTVEMIAGLRRPDEGSVRTLGVDPSADRRSTTAAIGMQLQESALQARIRPIEAVRLFSSFYRDPVEPLDSLESVGLREQARVPYARLSGGQKQRLAVALALIGRPRLVLLDELTTGLDPEARRGIWSLVERVRAEGVTVVLVTHSMEEAERLCDRVAILRAGRLTLEDQPQAVVARFGGVQRMRFRASADVDEAELRALDDVESARVEGRNVALTGGSAMVAAVTGHLARAGVVAHDLRVDGGGLDDAYLRLMGEEKS